MAEVVAGVLHNFHVDRRRSEISNHPVGIGGDRIVRRVVAVSPIRSFLQLRCPLSHWHPPIATSRATTSLCLCHCHGLAPGYRLGLLHWFRFCRLRFGSAASPCCSVGEHDAFLHSVPHLQHFVSWSAAPKYVDPLAVTTASPPVMRCSLRRISCWRHARCPK